MSLSHRAQTWATNSDNMTIWKVLKDQWHPQTNPTGFVSLGVAENALMHDDLTCYIQSLTHVLVPPNGLTYGDGGSGSKRLRTAIAHFLNRKLHPAVPLTVEHICATNGVTTAIEHISTLLANPGDVFLLGQPYYGAFIDDIQLRTGVEVVRICFGDVDPVSLEAVTAYEHAIRDCQKRGRRVAGLMLCNPHNPLGRCYSHTTIKALMRLCNTHRIHLVSDEIYAFSVFRSQSSSSSGDTSTTKIEDFTSLLSIPTADLIDPSLTHVLYGISKDFGANGLRLGCIISQHNPTLHKALIPVCIYSYVSSLTESVVTHLFHDDAYIDWYITTNAARLRANYDFITAWADRFGIKYTPGVNAAFFLWVQLGSVYERIIKEGRTKITPQTVTRGHLREHNPSANPDLNPSPYPHFHPTSETAIAPNQPSKSSLDSKRFPDEDFNLDQATNTALLAHKIFLAAGPNFGSEKPGWFRIVFSQQREILDEGLRRIERALGLEKKNGSGSGSRGEEVNARL